MVRSVGRRALGAALAALGGLLAPLPALPALGSEPPAMEVARRAVYGGAQWRAGEQAAPFFPRNTLLHVHEAFRAAYREQDQDKLLLVYQLTPGPREQFRCHACIPALGAAVMARDLARGLGSQDGEWRLQARAPLLMWGAPFSGDEDLQLLALGPQRWALRSRFHDVGGGYETHRERLLLQQRGRLVLALDEGFTDKPGPGACGPGAATQGTALQPLAGSEAAPRLELILRYNEGACPAPQARVERRRYELRDGRFQPE